MISMRTLTCSVFLLCCFLVKFGAAAQVGEDCVIKATNGPGTCVLLKNCDKAVQDIPKRIYPQICGYKGPEPIVCCAGKSPSVVSRSKPGDISEKKCWEYSEENYRIEDAPTYGLGDTQKVNISVCTLVHGTQILGGVNAKNKEFPHMALVGFEGNDKIKRWLCGGTLISNKFVLTAGHCLASREWGAAKWIRLGELNLAITTEDASPIDVLISKIIKHPDYKPPSRYNDIALLEMDRQIKFNSYIRPACLYFKSNIPDNRLIATGWGLTENNGQKGSDHLQKVELEKFSSQACNASYESRISDRQLKYGIIHTQMCAGSRDSEKDTCQGDSGGPLQIYHPEAYCMYSIIGVTSFGKVCGLAGSPGVYTKVSEYIQWIEQTVWP